MGVKTIITNPIILPHWSQDLFLTILRIVFGYFLSVGFGSPKFGLPWTNPDYGLELIEVAFWFPVNVAKSSGIFAVLPEFFAWMGAFSAGFVGILLAMGI